MDITSVNWVGLHDPSSLCVGKWGPEPFLPWTFFSFSCMNASDFVNSYRFSEFFFFSGTSFFPPENFIHFQINTHLSSVHFLKNLLIQNKWGITHVHFIDIEGGFQAITDLLFMAKWENGTQNSWSLVVLITQCCETSHFVGALIHIQLPSLI